MGSLSIATDKDVKLNARAALRIALLLLLLAVLAPTHVLTRLILGRSNWPHRFLLAAAWILGVRARVAGHRPGRHALIVANHTSWLDILILGGTLRGAFVSKDELGHPFIHWLADQNDTVYVKRSHRKGAKDQAETVAEALEGRKPVIVFPEGTTGPGTYLLPFRSSLLEAINIASRDVRVRPVAVDYGPARAKVGWFEEPGSENVKRILGRPGILPVTVHVLAPLDASLDRKQLTHEAREAIAKKLGLTSHSHSPIGG
ncbi:MAG TPA: lysophospholipid acyltransferase family protein [Sphingomicrobium sp.]|jgi:1-acyl-sn-glycerol-3-phosphate acyltransferase|nr:lysophospholipid acyltransferase family protein [Sphingomicrobium sp.]